MDKVQVDAMIQNAILLERRMAKLEQDDFKKRTEKAERLLYAVDNVQSLLYIAKQIHYPECWDTMAYPSLAEALWECVDNFDCTEHEHNVEDNILDQIEEAQQRMALEKWATAPGMPEHDHFKFPGFIPHKDDVVPEVVANMLNAKPLGSEFAQALADNSWEMYIEEDPTIKTAHDPVSSALLSFSVLSTAANAVADSAEVWTGFAALDAKTCIQSALRAVPPETINHTGPGTPSARLNGLLNQLATLFPNVYDKYSSSPAELAYIEHITKLVEPVSWNDDIDEARDQIQRETIRAVLDLFQVDGADFRESNNNGTIRLTLRTDVVNPSIVYRGDECKAHFGDGYRGTGSYKLNDATVDMIIKRLA